MQGCWELAVTQCSRHVACARIGTRAREAQLESLFWLRDATLTGGLCRRRRELSTSSPPLPLEAASVGSGRRVMSAAARLYKKARF